MKELLSVSEYCEKYKKDPGNVRKLLISGRLNGDKIGNQWVIASKEAYPKDNRIKTGKYKNYRNKMLLYANKDLMKNIRLMNKELEIAYKDNLVRVVVYGSYARNEQTDDSDVDIALFVKKDIEREKLIDISYKYEVKCGKVLSVIDINEKKYKEKKDILPFYKNIEKEGIEVWRKI